MDITAFCHSDSCGQILSEKLTKNNDLNMYHTICRLFNQYSSRNKILLDHEITDKYFYALVFHSFKDRAKSSINTEYLSYVLNILTRKYRMYNRMREKMIIESEQDEPMIIENEFDSIDSFDNTQLNNPPELLEK